jgi:hypothetical protein
MNFENMIIIWPLSAKPETVLRYLGYNFGFNLEFFWVIAEHLAELFLGLILFQ